jgi:hypothetical protein
MIPRRRSKGKLRDPKRESFKAAGIKRDQLTLQSGLSRQILHRIGNAVGQ